MKRIIANLLMSVGMIALLTGCANTYFVQIDVNGLTGGGSLTLQNNGGDTTVFTGDGAMPTGVVDNMGYNITIVGQPNGLYCTVVNGVGTIQGANATVTINCSPIAPGPRFTIGGTVAALTGHAPYTASPLVLSNSGVESITLAPGALPRSFTFPTGLPFGSYYQVSVTTDPLGPQTCAVTSGGFGTVIGSNITDVEVTCGLAYGISGTVTGLPAGRTVVLGNDGTTAHHITVAGVGTGSTSIPFNLTPQAAGNHTVAVVTQPTGLPAITCAVTTPAGGVVTVPPNVTNVVVTCS